MEIVPFMIERVFNAPIEIVWKAISDKDEMKKWYIDLSEFKAEASFKFQFSSGPDPNRIYLHLCEVKEVIVNRKLSYSWRYDGYEGDSLVTFELFEEGKTTRLKLTHSGLETFTIKNPDFKKENFAAGWTAILGTSLKDFLK